MDLNSNSNRHPPSSRSRSARGSLPAGCCRLSLSLRFLGPLRSSLATWRGSAGILLFRWRPLIRDRVAPQFLRAFLRLDFRQT